MNIFEGLEKFGLDVSGQVDLFGDEKKNENAQNQNAAQKEAEPTETDFLLDRTVRCTVCDHSFKTKAVKSSKLRRLEPDRDLRPRFQYIDTLKYDVTSCPYCGYTAMNRYFEHISTMQMKLLKEGVGSKFTATVVDIPEVFSYDYAMERYKLSLFNTIVKKGTTSEKAYTCLKLAWLARGKREELIAQGAAEDAENVQKCKAEEKAYYGQAYEGMVKAVATESFPICGMDQNTMDLLLAAMAFGLEKYEESYRFLSRMLTSRSAGSNIKNRGLDLKEEIVAKLRANKA